MAGPNDLKQETLFNLALAFALLVFYRILHAMYEYAAIVKREDKIPEMACAQLVFMRPFCLYVIDRHYQI